jgi:hypothetical protein
MADSKGAVAVAGWREFLMVAVFCAVGAFVTGMPAVSAAPQSAYPYHLASYQLVLKLAIGPTFALFGVLAIQSDLVDQFMAFKSFGGAVLVWAAVFGGAQQLLTAVFDRRAATISARTSAVASTAPVTSPSDSA